jgi:surface protein
VTRFVTDKKDCQNASKFNKNIGSWNVSSVQNMRQMFLDATMFNQDIGQWNTSNVDFIYSLSMTSGLGNGNIV